MDDSASAFPLADYAYQDRPAAAAILRLFGYWQAQRGQRFAPRRADIDPAAIVPLLPDIVLYDVIDGGRDFRFRLIGTRIVEGLGRDSTGCLVSERYAAQPTMRQRMLDRLQRVAILQQPVFGRGRIHWLPDRAHKRFEHVELPLSNDGATVDIILGALIILRAA